MYSTQIYDTYSVAVHIHKLDIDSALGRGDLSVVDRIASVSISGKPRKNVSFASKYCSWHRPESFPIYDSYVDEALWQFKRRYRFASFLRKDLCNYQTFVRTLDLFKEKFGLSPLSRKELDQYLWVEGKKILSA